MTQKSDLGNQAKGVTNPLLSHIKRNHSEKLFTVNNILAALTNHKALRFKQAIADARSKGSEPFHCPRCGGGVYLSRSPKRRFFFKHSHDERFCSYQLPPKERAQFIEDMEYRAVRESALHVAMKNEIANCLLLDDLFDDVQIQKRYVSSLDSSKYKIPDVSAKIGEISVVFEAQINNTFFQVAQRLRAFYQNEGACLAWIMPYFDPHSAKTVQEDVIIQQADTAFVVDEETMAATAESGLFTLKAYSYLAKTARWAEQMVTFADIILDQRRGIIRVEPPPPPDRRKELQEVALLMTDADHTIDWSRYDSAWRHLCELASDHDIALDTIGMTTGLRTLIRATQSAILGRPYGWNYDHLIQIAHHLSDYDWISLGTFLKIVTKAGHDEILHAYGDQEKWARKKTDMREFWHQKKHFYNKTTKAERKLAREIFQDYRDCIVEPSN